MRLWIAILVALPLHGAFALQQYSASDLGGSPVPIGAGTRALAMGGAFVAIADDASAATWNPAGMTQLERPEASLSAGYYWRSADYSGVSSQTNDTDLDHAAVVLPFFLGVQQTIGFAWQRQFDFTKSQEFQQHELVPDIGFSTEKTADVSLEQQGGFASLGFSYAIEPVPGFSLGFTGQTWEDRLTGRGAYDQNFSSRTETVFTDTGTGLVFGDELDTFTSDTHVEVEHGNSAVIGALWHVNSALSLGMNCKPSYVLHLTHHQIEHQQTDDLLTGTPIGQSDSDVRFDSELRLPLSAALGGAWRFDDLRTLSLDVTWTHWQQYRTTTGGVTTSPVNPLVSPDNYPDGYTARVGYEHILILPRVVLVPRMGLSWESVPGSTAVDPLQPQTASAKLDHYYGITAGLGIFQRRILYEIAGQYRFAKDVVGENSGPDQREQVHAITVRAGIAVQF